MDHPDRLYLVWSHVAADPIDTNSQLLSSLVYAVDNEHLARQLIGLFNAEFNEDESFNMTFGKIDEPELRLLANDRIHWLLGNQPQHTACDAAARVYCRFFHHWAKTLQPDHARHLTKECHAILIVLHQARRAMHYQEIVNAISKMPGNYNLSRGSVSKYTKLLLELGFASARAKRGGCAITETGAEELQKLGANWSLIAR